MWVIHSISTAYRPGRHAGHPPGFDRHRLPVTLRDCDGLLLPDQYDQPLAARDAGMEQISLEHDGMLRHH